MSEMVRRVAAAILEAEYVPEHVNVTRIAQAAIAAMRIPTAAMEDAADREIGHGAHEDWAGAYTAMIDEALK